MKNGMIPGSLAEIPMETFLAQVRSLVTTTDHDIRLLNQRDWAYSGDDECLSMVDPT